MAYYEESNPCDVDIDELIHALIPHFSDIKKDDLRFYYHGTYNVFEFRHYILRVPDSAFRNELGRKLIETEVKKLNNLRKFLNYAIPRPLIVSLEEKMPFMVYEKLKGVPLSTVFASLSIRQKNSIAQQIAEFLNQLHSPSLLHQVDTNLFETDFTTGTYKQFWETRFKEIQKVAFPLLNSSQRSWAILLFETFLENPHNFHFIPALTHCDFDTSNILVDPERGIVTAIVDFEDIKIWDPAADLLFFEDPEFHEILLEAYHFRSSESLQNRMRFFYSRTWAPYIMTGIQLSKPSMVQYGLDRLEMLQSQFPNQDRMG